MQSVDAEALQALGFNVIPMNVAEKRSPIKWGEFIEQRSLPTDVRRWKESFGDGWGIVTGPISGIFVLDIDGAEGKLSLENIKAELPETWVTRTQRGGLHYYFKWDTRLNDLPTSKYALLPKVDIRGRGGYVVAYPWLEGYSPADTALAPIPEWLLRLVIKPKQEETGNRPGWIADSLNNLDVGKRHAAFAKLIGRFNRDGFAPDDIYTLLAPHAEACGFSKAELLEQTRDMCKRYADQAAKPMCGITSKQLLSSASVKIPWLVDGLMPREGVGILAGHAKIGKSWLTLDLAITTSQGGAWLNKFQVQPGHVFYIDEESSLDLLSYRYQKLLKYRGLTDANIRFFSKEGFSFSQQNKIDELRQAMNIQHPKLVIIDSLNRVHRANENSSTEMGEIFRRVSALSKEFGCFILFTDHLPHGQERFRGSTDKEAFVDTGFLASKIGNSNILVEHKYARVTEPVRSFELALQDDGEDKTYVRWIG